MTRARKSIREHRLSLRWNHSKLHFPELALEIKIQTYIVQSRPQHDVQLGAQWKGIILFKKDSQRRIASDFAQLYYEASETQPILQLWSNVECLLQRSSGSIDDTQWFSTNLMTVIYP